MSSYIVVRQTDGSSERLKLEGERVRVGRSTQGNDISFPKDQSLSRHHLVFERDGDAWFVIEHDDPRPKNPTLVNGERLEGRRSLVSGDRVVAGKIEISFDPREEESSSGVVFYHGQDDVPLQATVMTRLDGLYSGDVTTPESRTPTTAGAVADRRLPLEHPAVAALVRACRELPGHRPMTDLFRLILDLSIEAVGAERGVLMSLEGERLLVQAQRGDEFRISSTVRDRVMNDRDSILVRDTHADEIFKNQQSIVGQHIRTMMAAPLQTKDRVLGLIHVDSRSFAQEFTPDDLGLLTVLANIAAIRVEQERLSQIEFAQKIMERDLEQAARIQRRLLPSSAPAMDGFDLAGHNAPSRTVGGDYFDFFRHSNGRVGAVLGDVAGKGLPAALLMTSLKGGVQVLAEVSDDVPVLLQRLNRSVCANFPANRFVSLFFGIIDPAKGSIAYCNAGHNPPLVVRASGDVVRLLGTGSILGFDPDSVFDVREIGVSVGDTVVLYSDGVTEATDLRDEEFREERLADVVRDAQGASASDVVRRICEAVDAWSAGAPPADDITLVVIRRTS